jgi:hypothetical protein
LRAHVCKDGETCGQKIDRAEESLKRNVLDLIMRRLK